MAKRLFDIFFSLLGLLILGLLLFVFWLLTCIDTRSNGFFIQERIGQWGRLFRIYKLKTMHHKTAKISSLGFVLRKYKIDELPQLWNVFKGDMSFVGPRPDIAGYYDLLEGKFRKILELKPGITSPAAIKYKKEEQLLALQEQPLIYNDKVIFPDKLRMNLDYYYHRSFFGDIKILFQTFFG